MVEIEHGGTYFKVPLSEYVRTRMTDLARRRGVRLSPLTEVSGAPPVQACVNHGQWKVLCVCGGCEFAWLDEPLMMCCSCWNRSIGGAWRRVEFPADRPAIERVLKARPNPPNRNWTAAQSVDDLKAENRAEGDPEEV